MAIGQPKILMHATSRAYEETHVNMFKESKSAIRMAKDSECWKTLTSQKDPAPPEG
jgi:hypothetical protein